MSTLRDFSYIDLTESRRGRYRFAVAAYALTSSGPTVVSHRMSVKWCGDSYGLALLHAQRLSAETGWRYFDKSRDQTVTSGEIGGRR